MMMKKKAMKREYTTPQCTILSEEIPFLLANSVRLDTDSTPDPYPDDDNNHEVDGGW